MRLKKIFKKILPRKLFDVIRDLVYPEKIHILEDRMNSFFLTHYHDIASPELSQKIAIKNAEFKVYSKHGNDGILLYLFSKIGVTNRTFVEIGTEDGRQCNTSNLSLNFGWSGLMIDGNKEWIESAKAFFKGKLGDCASKVKTVTSYVTTQNINELLKDNSITGEIDLFSLDIDGNDYWVWDAIRVINPRVVVLEYNAALGHRPLTLAYDPEHRYRPKVDHPLYFGASLNALTALSKKKGYVLVGCDTHGHDAFFLRSDVAQGKFRALSPEEAFYSNPYAVGVFGNIDMQFELIKHMRFEKV